MRCARNHAMNTARRQFGEFPVHLCQTRQVASSGTVALTTTNGVVPGLYFSLL
jgi:hypothetical protein